MRAGGRPAGVPVGQAGAEVCRLALEDRAGVQGLAAPACVRGPVELSYVNRYARLCISLPLLVAGALRPMVAGLCPQPGTQPVSLPEGA